MSTLTPCPDVVIIGGGIAGSSIAFQLSKRGRRVLVLERDLLGSGSTGRAAGLLGQVRGTVAATRMMMDSLRVVMEVEGRLGVKLFHRTGSLRLATTPERDREVREQAAFGRSLGLEVDLIGREELRADRYHDLPGFRTREEIKEKGRKTYASYYGGKKAAAK